MSDAKRLQRSRTGLLLDWIEHRLMVGGTLLLLIALIANATVVRPHQRWVTVLLLGLFGIPALFAVHYLPVWFVVKANRQLAFARGFVRAVLILDAVVAVALLVVLVGSVPTALPLSFYFVSLLGSVAAAARLWRLYLEPLNGVVKGEEPPNNAVQPSAGATCGGISPATPARRG